MTLDGLVKAAAAHNASDIHLRADHPPLIRINGVLDRWDNVQQVTSAELDAIAAGFMSPHQREKFEREHEVDVARQIAGVGRCRISIFRQRGTTALSLRIIPEKVPSLEELGLPPSVVALSEESRGLVVVTGVTGSGKSTTLAALTDLINRTRPVHVLTIEDPIEFVHHNARATVTQREIGFDTLTYASGLRAALRQDPDVILLGEMRDLETIETALVAAETGHLVFSTLHTLDAPETVNRIISVFPPHQQGQIRLQLARVLKAAISQRLMPRADGTGRALAAEVLISTAYVRDCIREPMKTAGIADAIVAGRSEYGMQSFDQSILELCQHHVVTVDEAVKWVTNVEEFKMRLRGITPGSAASAASASIKEIVRFGT